MMSGLPALPIATMRPSLMPMSPFTTPSTGSRMIALVITVSGAPLGRRRARRLRHAVADRLAAAEDRLLAVDRVVVLDAARRGSCRRDGRGRRSSGRRARRSRARLMRLMRRASRRSRASRARSQRRVARRGVVGRALDEARSCRAATPRAAERDQRHRCSCPGLEAHRRAGRNVEAHAERGARGRSAARG